MVFCSYGRKSIFSDKSDSVDNQFRMCRDYLNAKFPGQVDDIVEYSDEDYTGANTERPGLQRMLSDIDAGLYGGLVVYQLDRLSRDVRDFSNIYAMLEKKKCMFISIKENIDTATPIGRAMMYVTVVFAQMERETIAARVADNMLGLAKKGYWTGGRAPVGYASQRMNVGGRNHCVLVPDPAGMEYMVKFLDGFIDGGFTLTGYVLDLRQRGIPSYTGKPITTPTAHKYITMAWGVPANAAVYDYFESRGCQMGAPREAWNGSHGVIVYGQYRHTSKTTRTRKPDSERVVCIGMQEPFLDAGRWLQAQAQLARHKFDKTMHYGTPLLKAVLRCARCGSLMGLQRKKYNDGVMHSWYRCARRKRGDGCDCPAVKCETLDSQVVSIFREITVDPDMINKYVAAETKQAPSSDAKKIQARIVSTENKISRLAGSLAVAEGSAACKYIIAEMERLDLEAAALRREMSAARAETRRAEQSAASAREKAAEIARLIHGFDGFSDLERNAIARDVIKECTWDGSELFFKL